MRKSAVRFFKLKEIDKVKCGNLSTATPLTGSLHPLMLRLSWALVPWQPQPGSTQTRGVQNKQHFVTLIGSETYN